MNRRFRERVNVSQNGSDDLLFGSFDSIDGPKDQFAQFSFLLTAFRNEIFQRLDENNRQMRHFISETKQEIFKKINNSGKQYKSSQNKLKHDIITNIDNLKIFAGESGGFRPDVNNFRSDVSESRINEETKSSLFDEISVKSEPNRSLNYGDEVCSNSKSDSAPNERDDLCNDQDLSLPEKSLDSFDVEHYRKGDSRCAQLKLLNVVADKVDILCRRLTSVSDLSSISNVKTDEKLENDNASKADLCETIEEKDINSECSDNKNTDDSIEQTGASELVMDDKTAEVSNLRTENILETPNEKKDISQAHIRNTRDGDTNNTKDLVVKTGAIKKIFNDIPSKDLVLAASINQEINEEELEEIVRKLGKVLGVEYDRENVRLVCRQNSIVIKFRNNEEFEKWRGAAREIVEKEKFSYQELLDLEEVDVIFNSEKFECPICLMECAVGEGITLRDCLHSFCRQCIVKTVEHNTEMEIKCPFADDDYTCPSVIQHREIKEVIPKELYEQYLDKTFSIVGNRLGNTVHCKTPDCRNFYICDDDILTFYCDSCKSINCVPCKAVHTGMNCKEYQDELKILSETDPKARETLRMIEKMIRDKEAIPCPQCLVIVMKTEGCDWIQCSMCKTEICWATLGPRWGPEGRGDTSGGCKCKLNGLPCHENCRNCH